MDIEYYKKYEHRMGTRKLKLIGQNGKPVANTVVSIRQTKHQFLFGCAEFSSIPFANNELNQEENERAKWIFKKFFDLFNYVTLPFYWSNFENVRGQPDTERLKKTAQWFKENGCTIKGHPLCWHTLAPSWLLDMTNAKILELQLERIRREMKNFTGLIDIWDVVNEAVIMPIFNKYDNGITRICKSMGRICAVQEMFSAAKESNPGAFLMINDFVYTGLDAYEILIEGCLEAGVPIDAIGIQSHMHQGYWGVERTCEVLERFSRFMLPIHFTESTLVSGHTMPRGIEDFNDYVIDKWPSTPEGEERQAKEAALHYKTLFSHPLVESITWWDFVDGQWLGAPTGFVSQDNRLKPIYDELHKLIKKQWWTGAFNAVTDKNGEVTVSGFFGDYEAIAVGMKGNFKLDRGEESKEIKVALK